MCIRDSIEGRLKTRKWTDDQGRDRYSTEVQCIDFTFLTPKGEQATGNPAHSAPQQAQAPIQKAADTSSTQANNANPPEDDLPF